MSKRRLSLTAFQNWLASKHPRTKVGLACEADFCPLAKFLTQTTGNPYEVQGDNSNGAVQLTKPNEFGDTKPVEGTEIDLPQWAQDFINIVDSKNGSVSAAAALRITERGSLGRDRGHNRFY